MNRSSYYKHFKDKVSPRLQQNQLLRSQILSLYSSSGKRLGAYKIVKRLSVEYGQKVSPGRVYRLMRSMALPKMSTQKHRLHYSSDSSLPCPNLLNQQFNPKAPNLIWVSDITYVRVASSFCSVCVIIDLFSRKVISYTAGTRINTPLVLDALALARKKRGYPEQVLFHSDRGCQYTSALFRKALDAAGFIQSFSAKGHPYDNAVAESFFKYLKHEELNRRSFSSLAELKLSLFEYIEGFYNRNRPHSANHFLSPEEKEMEYFQQ